MPPTLTNVPRERSRRTWTASLLGLAFVAACTPTPDPGRPRSSPGTPAGPSLSVTIDSTAERQTIVGFGGDVGPVVELTDFGDKRTAVEFAYETMGLDHARANLIYPEGSSEGNIFGANDNGDFASIDWSRFNFCVMGRRNCANDWPSVLEWMRAAGSQNEYWGLIQGPKWNGFDGRSTFDPRELAEHQLATYLHFRDRVPKPFVVEWLAPFSEPGGGGINWPISEAQAVAAIRAIGTRLESAEFRVKMIVPDATNLEQSIRYATAILADREARRFVGAIGYHTYDSGRSGTDPDADFISLRARLRDLAAAHGLPVRMTERFDISGFLERANDVLNELTFASSQTYNAQHIFSTNERDPGALVHLSVRGGRLAGVRPTRDTGVAIGHFSRWAAPGTVRLETRWDSGSAVRAASFLDAGARTLTVVLINNLIEPRTVSVLVNGERFRVLGTLTGERSIEGQDAYWSTLEERSPSTPRSFELTLPGRSVTSVRVPVSDPSIAAPASAGTP